MRSVRLLSLLPLLAACAGGDVAAPVVTPPHALTAREVVVVRGDSQLGQVGLELAAAIVVEVRDSLGRPVRGQSVAFRVTQGGGSTFLGMTQTDSLGEARERWRLGVTAGAQELEARAVDERGQPIVFAVVRAIAAPGPLAWAGFTARTLRTLGGDVLLPVLARDAYGNRLAAPALASLDSVALRADTAELRRPGRARFTIGAETLTVRSHVPVGAVEWVRRRADTTWTGSGRLEHLGWKLASVGDTAAVYALRQYGLERNVAGVAGVRGILPDQVDLENVVIDALRSPWLRWSPPFGGSATLTFDGLEADGRWRFIGGGVDSLWVRP